MAVPSFDIYLKLAGFAGEVAVQKYKDEIEVLSFEQGTYCSARMARQSRPSRPGGIAPATPGWEGRLIAPRARS